jgi:hypothetical protein
LRSPIHTNMPPPILTNISRYTMVKRPGSTLVYVGATLAVALLPPCHHLFSVSLLPLVITLLPSPFHALPLTPCHHPFSLSLLRSPFFGHPLRSPFHALPLTPCRHPSSVSLLPLVITLLPSPFHALPLTPCGLPLTLSLFRPPPLSSPFHALPLTPHSYPPCFPAFPKPSTLIAFSRNTNFCTLPLAVIG